MTDYGDLREITASFRMLVGATSTDMSFSSPGAQQPGPGGTGGDGGPPPGEVQHAVPDNVGNPGPRGNAGTDVPGTSADGDAPGGAESPDGADSPGAGSDAGGAGSGGGGSSGGGSEGGGGSLPFTGLAAGAVAAVGSALAAAGTALRRRTRRPPERDT